MYTVQVHETLQSFIQIFYRIGIWQSEEESSVRIAGKKSFYTFFGALFPIFFATSAWLCDDRKEAIFLVQVTILASVIYLKSLYLLFKQKEIVEFLNGPVIVHTIESSEDHKERNVKIERFIKFTKFFVSLIRVSSAIGICIPLPVFSTAKVLPLLISLSWSDSEIIYWLAYLFLACSILLYNVLTLITIIIWYIMLNYSIEYQLLGNKLKNLGVEKEIVENKKTIKPRAENKKNARLPPSRSLFLEDLIVRIKAHRKLTETIERFRSEFAPPFLAQISTSGICICVAVFNLAFASYESILQKELYTFILFYVTFDIFFIMYLANEITDASDRLSYCLFESNWVDQTESRKKYVLILGEVLKQPQKLLILIYPLNLDTFTSIANGAYSMFNILKSNK